MCFCHEPLSVNVIFIVMVSIVRSTCVCLESYGCLRCIESMLCQVLVSQSAFGCVCMYLCVRVYSGVVCIVVSELLC